MKKEKSTKFSSRFTATKSVVDAQIHGSGLGLNLVKQIIEAHSGKVYVKSEFGKGSGFTIELKSIKAEK